MEQTAPLAWVYDNLICEFDHYDCCLTGLVSRDGERLLCRIVSEEAEQVEYTLHPVTWDAECEEYLEDYRIAYKHWFHEGYPRCSYDGWDLSWFSDKWKKRNPITNQLPTRE